MCKECGCQDANKKHHHDHDHDHKHDHEHSRIIELEHDVLSKNDEIAGKNRKLLEKFGIKALNIISSPGSGKTLLLERTLEQIGDRLKIAVITGDQQTDNDARRLKKYGKKVRQINTISACHLDAQMISRELASLVDDEDDLLIIENVGNLVCPAAFDLGEHNRVALLSVTEGEDKPVKYPALFHSADIVLITKTDLIPHLDWSMEKCLASVKQVQPKARILEISAKTGEGMGEWLGYLVEVSKTH